MKRNSPVTSVETPFDIDESIYSRTDLKGQIEEVNDSFVRMSGFSRDELIGKAHNIVRHPDVPPAAFADLWADLQQGRPWRSVVKNWRKDGGYYWVVANASPVRNAEGKTIGYQSVRFAPSRAEIQAAEAAFQRINAGDKSLSMRHGKVIEHKPLRQLLHKEGFALSMIGLLAIAPSLASLAGQGQTWLAAFSVLAVPGGLAWFQLRNQNLRNTLMNWMRELLQTGDLRRNLPDNLSKNPQIAELGDCIHDFVCAMRATVKGVEDIAQQVAQVARDAQISVDGVYTASRVQSEATSASAAAVEEVTASISQIASQSADGQQSAEEAGNQAREGVTVSQHAMHSIHTLAGFIRTTARQVNTLGLRTDEINQIVGLIREIAEQTNLLALNAAIEAARAGEQGRGFAVVADEVRKLAERTAQATAEISRMITGIHAEVSEAVGTMKEGETQIDACVNVVTQVGNTLEKISTGMHSAIAKSADIVATTTAQKDVMQTMTQHVERVNAMTHSNVANAAQTKALTDQLQAIGARMLESARQYRV
ncbi:MAG: methyl-accepting chemotaxis protein [Sterolibacterium sp.]|nr:methyl-accepting chemotaxis protein [Sterolibacterium sp.]